jgi:hypothetical protein
MVSPFFKGGLRGFLIAGLLVIFYYIIVVVDQNFIYYWLDSKNPKNPKNPTNSKLTTFNLQRQK